MFVDDEARRMVADRGPRWAVSAQIRPGERLCYYADTADRAEQLCQQLEAEHYYAITVHPPAGAVDLTALGRARADAKRAYDQATVVLRAGVLRALEDGRAEAEVARVAQVDRMTVRAWRKRG